VVADLLYSHRAALYRSELLGREPSEDEEPLIERQALHARSIAIDHPLSGQRMVFEAPVPGDMAQLLATLGELRPRD